MASREERQKNADDIISQMKQTGFEPGRGVSANNLLSQMEATGFTPTPQPEYEGYLGNIAKGTKAGGAGVYAGIANWYKGGDNDAARYLNDVVANNQRAREYQSYGLDYITDPSGLAYDFGNLLGSQLALAPAYLIPGGGLAAKGATTVASKLLGSGFARSAAGAIGKEAALNRALNAATTEAGKQAIGRIGRYAATSAPAESLSEGGHAVREAKEAGIENPYAIGAEVTAKNLPLLLASNLAEAGLIGRAFTRLGAKPGETLAKRIAKAPFRAAPYAVLTGAQQGSEEVGQEIAQEEALGKLSGHLFAPWTWTDQEKQVFHDTVLAGGLLGGAGSVRGSLRAPEERNNNLPTGRLATGNNSLNGFDSRYITKWESKPGATDLANVRDDVKAAFNGVMEEYGDNITITGGAEEGYHATGANGHEGGWKLDIDKASVKDPDKFLRLCAKYGFAVGDEGDHYDLSGHSQGGTGGLRVISPETFISEGGRTAQGAEEGQTGGFKSSGNAEYDAYIQSAAQKYNVPANLLSSLLEVESGYNPSAKSKAGALGIAQFIPETAQSYGIDPLDPAKAIEGAAHYLSDLYNQFGDWHTALRAYNGGPRGIDLAETKTYADKVLAGAGDISNNAQDQYPNTPSTVVIPQSSAIDDSELKKQYDKFAEYWASEADGQQDAGEMGSFFKGLFDSKGKFIDSEENKESLKELMEEPALWEPFKEAQLQTRQQNAPKQSQAQSAQNAPQIDIETATLDELKDALRQQAQTAMQQGDFGTLTNINTALQTGDVAQIRNLARQLLPQQASQQATPQQTQGQPTPQQAQLQEQPTPTPQQETQTQQTQAPEVNLDNLIRAAQTGNLNSQGQQAQGDTTATQQAVLNALRRLNAENDANAQANAEAGNGLNAANNALLNANQQTLQQNGLAQGQPTRGQSAQMQQPQTANEALNNIQQIAQAQAAQAQNAGAGLDAATQALLNNNQAAIAQGGQNAGQAQSAQNQPTQKSPEQSAEQENTENERKQRKREQRAEELRNANPANVKQALIELARRAWNDNEYQGRVSFAPSPKLRQASQNILGHDLDEVFITASDIRHIKKQHGEGEEAQGQIDITPNDFGKLIDVINDFTSVVSGETDKQGNQALKLSREDGNISFSVIAERGSHKAEVKTFYIKKEKAPSMFNAESPEQNARSDSITPSEENVPQQQQESNKKEERQQKNAPGYGQGINAQAVYETAMAPLADTQTGREKQGKALNLVAQATATPRPKNITYKMLSEGNAKAITKMQEHLKAAGVEPPSEFGFAISRQTLSRWTGEQQQAQTTEQQEKPTPQGKTETQKTSFQIAYEKMREASKDYQRGKISLDDYKLRVNAAYDVYRNAEKVLDGYEADTLRSYVKSVEQITEHEQTVKPMGSQEQQPIPDKEEAHAKMRDVVQDYRGGNISKNQAYARISKLAKQYATTPKEGTPNVTFVDGNLKRELNSYGDSLMSNAIAEQENAKQLTPTPKSERIFGATEDAYEEFLEATGLTEEDLDEEILEAPPGIENTAEERERLEREVQAELNKMSANPVFNPRLYTLGLKLAMTYVKDGINTVKKLVAKLKAQFGDKMSPWAVAIAETVQTWPNGVPFNENQVMATSKLVGALYENGYTSLEAVQREMQKKLRHRHKTFAPMIEASYNGIKKFFDELEAARNESAQENSQAPQKDTAGSDVDAGGRGERASTTGGHRSEQPGEVRGTNENESAETDSVPSKVQPKSPGDGRRPNGADNGAEESGRNTDSGKLGERGSRSANDGSRNGAGKLQADLSVTPDKDGTKPAETPGHNHHFKKERLEGVGVKTKFKNNVAAIRLLKQLEAEGRMATPGEQAILAKWNGWGTVKDAFTDKEDWAKEHKELRELLTKEEYDAAANAANNAFYTSPEVVSAMWQGLKRLGFKGGRVLDPSMGSGRFFGYMPKEMEAVSNLYGVEKDSLTGRLAKQLFQKADVQVKPFEQATSPNNFFDLAISNVPFGDSKPYDPDYEKTSTGQKAGYQLHNFFFAKSIDKVRPGGFMVFITGIGTMQSKGREAELLRAELDGKADLVAAFKLPGNAFAKDAGTQVTTDILVIQKRLDPKKPAKYAQKWDTVGEVMVPTQTPSGYKYNARLALNDYYDKHPNHMLGEPVIDTLYSGYDNTRLGLDGKGRDVGKELTDLMNKLPKDIYQPVQGKKQNTVKNSQTFLAEAGTREKSFVTKDGKAYQNRGGVLTPVAAAQESMVKDFVSLKNALNALLKAQIDPKATDGTLDSLRKTLNERYDFFVKKYGYLNSTQDRTMAKGKKQKGAATVLNSDPLFGQVAAIEKYKYDKKTKTETVEKTAIFTKRTVGAIQEVETANSPTDALAISLAQRGKLDIPYMANLLSMKEEDVTAALGSLVYENPVNNSWELAEEYLSGNVREKLAQAEAAAKTNPKYKRNAEALKKVQPVDYTAEDIKATIGAPWIPTEVYENFMRHILGGRTTPSVTYNKIINSWKVDVSANYNQVAMFQTWGAGGMSFIELLERTLAKKDIRVTYTDDEKRTHTDETRTAAAKAKAEEIQAEFEKWLWSDENKHKDSLLQSYNKLFNSEVERQYDGSALTFPGLAREIYEKLYPHQKNAIWRMMQGKNTLIAHCVGAGKTWEMQIAGMEMKRVGICRKPMYVVPNNIVNQFRKEFYEIYPNAKLLVLTSSELPGAKLESGATDFTEKLDTQAHKAEKKGKAKTKEKESTAKKEERLAKRRAGLSRIATEDWDGIIISQEVFAKMPMSPEYYRSFYQEQIDELDAAIRQMKDDKLNKRDVSNLEKAKANLEARLQRSVEEDKKEVVIPFEELGVDQLFVDEADMYKNLPFHTSMSRLSGVNPGGKGKAVRMTDMYVKTQYMAKQFNGRGVVFATGTPISNSMNELFTMQRYLDRDTLYNLDMRHFDQWASMFGIQKDEVEPDSSGNGFTTKTKLKFTNLDVLGKMFRRFADIKLVEDLPYLKRPKLKDGQRTVIAVEASPAYKKLLEEVKKRAEKISSRQVAPKDDNYLKITNDLRNGSLDMRLIDSRIPAQEADAKIQALCDKVYDKWVETKEQKGAQVIFSDIGISTKETKPSTDTSEAEAAAEEFAEIDTEAASVYQHIKDELIRRGIPAEEIAFVHDAKNADQRQDLFERVNNGDIRVFLGSTTKMGAGTNMQKKLCALHHLDCPWRPRDIEQREGRILRAGNEFEEAEIFTYVTKGSFDTNMWDKVRYKQQMIDSVMRGDPMAKEMEDVDSGASADFGDIEALSMNNPLMAEQVKINADVMRLSALASNHRNEQTKMRWEIAQLPRQIEQAKLAQARARDDIASRTSTKGDDFKARIGNKTYTKRKEAQAALEAINKSYKDPKSTKIGEIAGFDIHMRHEVGYVENKGGGVVQHGRNVIQLVNNGSYSAEVSIQSMEHVASTAPDRTLAQAERAEKQYSDQLKGLEQEIKKPFARQAELDAALKRQKEIADELNKDKEKGAELETALDIDGTIVKEGAQTSEETTSQEEAQEAASTEEAQEQETKPQEQQTSENRFVTEDNRGQYEAYLTKPFKQRMRVRRNLTEEERQNYLPIMQRHNGRLQDNMVFTFKRRKDRDVFVFEAEEAITHKQGEHTLEIDGHEVTIDADGNITGDTYPIKDIFKKDYGAKWNKDKKAWQITDKSKREEFLQKYSPEVANSREVGLIKEALQNIENGDPIYDLMEKFFPRTQAGLDEAERLADNPEEAKVFLEERLQKLTSKSSGAKFSLDNQHSEQGAFSIAKNGAVRVSDDVSDNVQKAIDSYAKTLGGKYNHAAGRYEFSDKATGERFQKIANALWYAYDPVNAAKYSITAWHGTPHNFERFTLQAIGTGEGAQVYGWGLYFGADREIIEENYRKRLSRGNNKGTLLQVEIPDEDVMLDYDLTFEEQSESVKAALKKLGLFEGEFLEVSLDESCRGQDFYEELTARLGSPQAASEALNEAGVKGITYEGYQDGRCYVVFDDQAINIIAKFSADAENAKKLLSTLKFADPTKLTKEQERLAQMGEEMGVTTVWIDADPKLNGFHSKGVTFLNRYGHAKPLDTFWHESYHWIKANNGGLAQELVDAVQEAGIITPKQIKQWQDSKNRHNLTDAETIEEIIADEFINPAKFHDLANRITPANPGLVQRLVAWIKKLADRFIEAMHGSKVQPGVKFSEADNALAIEDRVLTTAQRDNLIKAVGRLAGQIKDENGRNVFKVEQGGKAIKLADGKALPEVRFSFAGEKSATAPLDTLAKAKEMDGNASADEIWNETGWIKGKDGKWRYEIPDKLDKIDLDEITEDLRDGYNTSLQLRSIYDNTTLYSAYPRLQYVYVSTYKAIAGEGGYTNGADIYLSREMLLDNNVSDNKKKATLIHEIQHLIQREEEFAAGGTPVEARGAAKAQGVFNSNETDYDRYLKLGGEQEARESARRSVTRKNHKRLSTPTIHSDDAIIVFGGQEFAAMKNVASKATTNRKFSVRDQKTTKNLAKGAGIEDNEGEYKENKKLEDWYDDGAKKAIQKHLGTLAAKAEPTFKEDDSPAVKREKILHDVVERRNVGLRLYWQNQDGEHYDNVVDWQRLLDYERELIANDAAKMARLGVQSDRRENAGGVSALHDATRPDGKQGRTLESNQGELENAVPGVNWQIPNNYDTHNADKLIEFIRKNGYKKHSDIQGALPSLAEERIKTYETNNTYRVTVDTTGLTDTEINDLHGLGRDNDGTPMSGMAEQLIFKFGNSQQGNAFAKAAVQHLQQSEPIAPNKQNRIREISRSEEDGFSYARSKDDLKREAKAAFPNATITEDGDNLIMTMPNGQKVTVTLSENITATEEELASARKAHGIDEGASVTIEGYAETVNGEGFINLSQGSRRGTGFHEAYHIAEAMAFTKKELADAKRLISTSDEVRADKYAEWVQNRQKGNNFAKLWRKIQDTAAKMAKMLGVETQHNLFRQVESGEIYERSNTGRDTGRRYSANSTNESVTQRIKNILSGTPSNDYSHRRMMAETLGKALNLTIRSGKIADANGNVIYKESDRVLRTKHAYDWENLLPVASGIIAERLGIAQKHNQTTDEMRNYITSWILTGNPNDNSQEAKTFRAAMQRNPHMNNALQEVRRSFDEWNNMSAHDQMADSVQMTKTHKTDWKELKNYTYEQLVEVLAPVERLVQDVQGQMKKKGLELPDVINPMIAFRLSRGSHGRAITMIEGRGQAAVNALKKNFPAVDFTGFKTLHDILQSIDAFQNIKKQREFVTYCIAKHVLDMHAKNEQTAKEIEKLTAQMQNTQDAKAKQQIQADIDDLRGQMFTIAAEWSKANCEAEVNRGEAKFGQAQKDLVRFSNVSAAILKESGVISRKRYYELTRAWPNYVPLFRVFEDNEDIDFGDSMKHIKGSLRDIVNPLESIIKNTTEFVRKAENNKARCLLADLARCDGSGYLLEEVDNNKPHDKTTIVFYEDGERKYLQTDPEVVKAVNRMDADSSNAVLRVLHGITSWARACFTIASPEFAMRNIFRDYADAVVYNKKGFISPADIVRGILHAMRRDETYYEWLSSGAAISSAVSLDRNYTQEMINKLGRTVGSRIRQDGIKGFFGALLETLQKAGEYSEYGTRIAMYEHTKKHMTKGDTQQAVYEAMVKAAFESRDLMDFSRHGKGGKFWNQIVPFANASLQGMDKFYREFCAVGKWHENPKRMTRRLAGAVLSGVLPALLLAALFGDDDKYKEAPDWLKETHWLIPLPSDDLPMLRIPKGNDIAIRFFSNFIEKSADEKSHKFKEYLMPLWNTLPDFVPIALLPLWEAYSNKSMFTGLSVVPRSQENLPEKLQYGPYSTGMSKFLAEQLDKVGIKIAPRQIDHVWAGYSGSIGMFPFKAWDALAGDRQLDTALEEMPLTRAITYMPYKNPQVVQDFYEKYDEQSKLHNEKNLTGKKPEDYDARLFERLKATRKKITALNKKEKALIDNPNITPSERRDKQMAIQKQRITEARKVLGRN